MNAPRGSRGATYTRGKWYKAFKLDAERENLFTELDEDKHASMRARISQGVSVHLIRLVLETTDHIL